MLVSRFEGDACVPCVMCATSFVLTLQSAMHTGQHLKPIAYKHVHWYSHGHGIVTERQCQLAKSTQIPSTHG